MDVFMSALIKMSLRGVVIILAVLLVRVLLGKLRIGHKYILGLWAMVFLYFIFPWKLSLPVGFWNNAGITDEIRAISEFRPAECHFCGCLLERLFLYLSDRKREPLWHRLESFGSASGGRERITGLFTL